MTPPNCAIVQKLTNATFALDNARYKCYNSSKVNKRNKTPDPRQKVLRQSYSVPRKYIVAHFVNFCNHKMTVAGNKKTMEGDLHRPMPNLFTLYPPAGFHRLRPPLGFFGKSCHFRSFGSAHGLLAGKPTGVLRYGGI